MTARTTAGSVDAFIDARRRMVEEQIAARGSVDRAVLDTILAVPGERCCVPAAATEFAYDDTPLPVGEGQTISQPYVVALMAPALRLTRTTTSSSGAGSGYAAALSRIGAEVYAIERHEVLAALVQTPG